MNNLKDKLLKTMLLLLFPLTFAGEAAGQGVIIEGHILPNGFAGEDKVVFYRSGTPSMEVKLGSDEERYGASVSPYPVQYYWEVLSLDGDVLAFFPDENTKKSPMPTLNVGSETGVGTIVLCCTRTSKYGYQTDFVNVTLTNTIEIVAKPIGDCWAEGEEIALWQFDIKTIPTGFESYVDLANDSRIADHDEAGTHGTQEIHFVSYDPERYPMGGEGTTVPICVVAPSGFINLDIPISRDAIKKINAFKQGGEFLQRLKKVEEVTDPIKKISGTPIEYSWGFDGGTVSFSQGVECCCHEDAYYFNLSGGISASVFFRFRGPILSIPALQWFIGLNGSASASLANVKWVYFKESEDCTCSGWEYVPWSLNAELEGGVALVGVSRDFLSVGGFVSGGINVSGNFLMGNIGQQGLDTKLLSISAYGKAKVEAVLLGTKLTEEVTFVSKELFNESHGGWK